MPTEHTTTSASGLDVSKLLPEFEVPFSPDQIRWRVTSTTNDKKRRQIMPYADCPAYINRLKALFTPQGWNLEYSGRAGSFVPLSRLIEEPGKVKPGRTVRSASGLQGVCRLECWVMLRRTELISDDWLGED
jgi:hypothetical protein